MVTYSIEKIANSILFFLEKDVQSLGKTKLMKLLFYTDKFHLQSFGRSVFGDTYNKLPQGPVASLTLNTINSLNETDNEDLQEYSDKLSEYIGTQNIQRYQYSSMEFIPKKAFDKAFFSKSEIEIMNKVVKKFKTYTATQISDLSHETPEYQSTADTEVITEELMAGTNAEYIAYWEHQHSSFEMFLASTK